MTYKFLIVCLFTISMNYYPAKLLLEKSNRKAVRNGDLDDIYKTENQLWDARQCSRTCCITSCFRHLDCRSFAYNSNTEQCQVFNRNFRGQNVPGNAIVDGILHYDIANVDCGMHGPFNNTLARDCAEVQSQGYTCSGVYTIETGGTQKQVWCDLQTDGGRWTVIQRRIDGSINFNVGWTEYKGGFGIPSQEYWIGNDALHALTSNGGTAELLILMERWNGVWVHARYSTFRINDENDKYRLTVSGFTGTTGDSLASHNGQKFSTKDQDNDSWPGACNPAYHAGGWWFYGCASSDLNGLYYESPIVEPDSCHWYTASNQRESLRTVFMMIRKY